MKCEQQGVQNMTLVLGEIELSKSVAILLTLSDCLFFVISAIYAFPTPNRFAYIQIPTSLLNVSDPFHEFPNLEGLLY